MNIKVFSPGKVIITGEHSVVYGEPALVAAIDLGVTVEVNSKVGQKNTPGYPLSLRNSPCSFFQHPYPQHLLSLFSKKFNKNLDNLVFKIDFNIPIKSGLGSSAACAHAIFLALLKYFDIKLSKEDLFDLVLEGEKFMHGNPSGVDPKAVVYGGLNSFQKKDSVFVHQKIKTNFKLDNFVLINSGQAQETTKEMVELVAKDLSKNTNSHKIIKKIGRVSQKIINDLKNDQFNDQLIKKNQKLLEELGVVGQKARKIVKLIENIGGVAKVTGAGGVKDGSGLLLAYHSNKEALMNLANLQQLEVLPIKFT